MKNTAQKRRMLLLSIALSFGASAAYAQDYAPRRMALRDYAGTALAPVVPPVTPERDSEGTQRLRLRVHYLETLTSNVELRRHQYFVDDNLKTQWPRTSIAWYVRLYF